jgi:hypothetical protein
VYCNAGPGVSFYADGSGSYDPRYEHVFHNTFYKNGISPLSQSDFRYTFGLLFDDVAGNNPAIPIVNAAIKNNLFYQNTGGDMYFYYTSAASQTVLGNYYATASNNSTPMAALAGNTVSTVNPMFADISALPAVSEIKNFDFHLQSSSPAIDKGVFLTATTAAGSGAVIAVADAGYFVDGYGITDGDLIQLAGQAQTARITKVDYGAHTITVDKSLTWESGQGVALAYYGTAPDIGAFEYNPGGSVQGDAKRQRNIRFRAYSSGRNIIVDATGLRERGSDIVALCVYDLAGKIVISLKNVHEDKLFASTAGLARGVYAYAVLLNAVSVYSGKIIFQ